MRMAPGVFWGIILILVGASIIFRILFGISIFRIVFGLLIIVIGIRVIIGHTGIVHHRQHKRDVIFQEYHYTGSAKNNTEYNTIFSKTVHDLRDIELERDRPFKIEINAIFGKSEVILNKNMPVRIEANAVFAGAKMPDGNMVAFGSINYSNNMNKDSLSYLVIEANAIFGAVEIRMK